MKQKWLCKLGFHRWVYSTSDRNVEVRKSECCSRQEYWFVAPEMGATSSHWRDYPVPKG